MRTDVAAQKLGKSKKRKIVILPIGSCEQHGPHLPIDTDLRIACLLAEHLMALFSDEETLLLSAIPFSCSWEHKGPGMIALSIHTLSAVLHDIAQSLKVWEVPIFLVLINWHGGNLALSSIATEITAQEGMPTAVVHSLPIAAHYWENEVSSLQADIHAGALETSIIQAFWPSVVDVSNLEDKGYSSNIPSLPTQLALQAVGMYGISPNGIWGVPNLAQPEKGKLIIEHTVNEIQQQILKLLKLINAL
jgi:creatinine amidohydrolase/Fe(II)-dependent formamide hydrolase-like protein